MKATRRGEEVRATVESGQAGDLENRPWHVGMPSEPKSDNMNIIFHINKATEMMRNGRNGMRSRRSAAAPGQEAATQSEL